MSSRCFTRTFAAVAGFAVARASAWRMVRPGRADNRQAEPKAAAKRKPWTTSKVTGSPEPPPKFKSVRVFPDVKFDHPLLIARCPGTDRLFVGEQDGVAVLARQQAGREAGTVLRPAEGSRRRSTSSPGAKGVGELYGLVFHPKFEENRYCYVCYTLQPEEPEGRSLRGRLAGVALQGDRRPTRRGSTRRARRSSSPSWAAGTTAATCTSARTGCSTSPPATPRAPTRRTRSTPARTAPTCSSSILRIDVDRKDAGKNYAVPKDNPFVGMKDVRPEIWAYGFRNPWRMSFDRKTGDLWVGDVGWELWEMVHKIEKGGNYGWSIVEGRQPVKPEQKIGPTPIRPPAIELPHTIARERHRRVRLSRQEVPGTGRRVHLRRLGDAPHLGGALRGRPAEGDAGDREAERARRPRSARTTTARSTYCDYDTGVIYTLERNDAAGANAKFPTKLSETGLFTFGEGPRAGGGRDSGSRPTPGSGRTTQPRSGTSRCQARPVSPSSTSRGRCPGRSSGTTSGCSSPRTRCW